MTVITASAAGGNWNTNGAWVGGVQPTAADDVLLTVTSGNVSLPTATTVVCRSIDCTGYTGTLTWASTTARLNVGDASGGAAKFVAGMTVTLTGIGTLGFLSTTASTTYALTSGGKTLPNIIVAAGASTTTQLADNLTSTGTLTLTSGLLDLNGKTVSVSVFDSAATGSARTLTMGASAVTITVNGNPGWTVAATNLTLNANTSTITFTGSGGGITSGGAGITYNDLVATGTTTFTVNSATVCANFTRTGPAAIDGTLHLTNSLTVSGTLTLTGAAASQRLWVLSTTQGTAKTITCNTTVTASRVDFEDITGAGTASWNLAGITDGSGDCGGNSGITFTTPATKFGMSPGNWSDVSRWSLTSNGATGAPYPLPQDNVVFDSNTGVGTYTMNMQRHCKDLTCTGFTGTLSLGSSATQRYIFGSLTLSAGMTFTATGSFTFAGRGSHTIDMAGKAFQGGTSNRTIPVGRSGGTYTLTSNADFGSNNSATTNAGLVTGAGVTFDAAGFSVTAVRVTHGTATVTMGAGVWSVTGAGDAIPWTSAAGTTINAGTSTIVLSNLSAITRTFAGGGKTYYDLTYTVAGSTGGLDITGANTFHDLNFSDVTNARTLRFTAATNTTFTGAFNVQGTSGKLMTVGSITAAQHLLTKASGTVSCDYLSISQSVAVGGGAAWYAGANSTDGGSNTGWIFTAPPASSGNFFLMF